MDRNVIVSVVIPVKNGGKFIGECLDSLLNQDFSCKWEISIYNDGSTDNTDIIIKEYINPFAIKGVDVILNSGIESGGVGFAKNMAISFSNGLYLCFCDADDIFSPNRLSCLFAYAQKMVSPHVFLGSCFRRIPENSTTRYTRWANELKDEQLTGQIYTSHGPTLIAPTWFLNRKLFDEIGGFRDDISHGFPEDLDFFFKSLQIEDVTYKKIPDCLVDYRFHEECATFGVNEKSIWDMRLMKLKDNVLNNWKQFSIWSVGKQGKRFYRCLSDAEKDKVKAFCDIDLKKISRNNFEEYDDNLKKVLRKVPIVSINDVCAPVVICVKLDMTGGDLERLVDEKDWKEGTDYILFS